MHKKRRAVSDPDLLRDNWRLNLFFTLSFPCCILRTRRTQNNPNKMEVALPSLRAAYTGPLFWSIPERLLPQRVAKGNAYTRCCPVYQSIFQSHRLWSKSPCQRSQFSSRLVGPEYFVSVRACTDTETAVIGLAFHRMLSLSQRGPNLLGCYYLYDLPTDSTHRPLGK